MPDIIHLLPDSIASQIAAGEVIQRPASVVKELMENSIDAKSTEITLVVKQAGKVLIQVSDNGIGMTDTDARMCFERHATSKISSANDIFKIKTKGFRGEALASIAAIAHVELITKKEEKDTGTKILINGSKFEKQEPIQSNTGTKISVKNLFFNVPARRKFLKSDAVELKHINDEFIRLALAHKDIAFSYYHNGKLLYQLAPSNLKQRIISLFGRAYDSKLLVVDEQMEIVKIKGYIGKIEAARKTRGNQYIFVNNRFIKSHYLNHAINTSYSEYIGEGSHPIFFLFLEIDPDKIDVNIHPTKEEIKFEDERLIYNFVRVTVKHVLGKFTHSPVLDFERSREFTAVQKEEPKQQNISKGSTGGWRGSPKMKPNTNRDEWEQAFEILKNTDKPDNKIEPQTQKLPSRINEEFKNSTEYENTRDLELFQLHNSYIVKQVQTGFLIIDQQFAHERILYDEFVSNYGEDTDTKMQQLLFPQVLDIDKDKIEVLKSLSGELEKFGFLIQIQEDGGVLLRGIPTIIDSKTSVKDVVSKIIDNHIDNVDVNLSFKDNISKMLAKVGARKKGESLNIEEMKYLVDNLFKSQNPYVSPRGKKCFIKYDLEEITKRFSK